MPQMILLLIGVASCFGQVPHADSHQHHHDSRSTEDWVRILEDPQRDQWQKPGEVIAALALEPGATVADIGAGTGYFSVRLARAVGEKGTAYAADIDPGLIDYLHQRARKEGLANLKPVLGKPDDPMLPASSIDLVFICDVIHHIENRGAYYAKLAAALRPSGRIAIVDFHKRELPVGPPPAMKIKKTDLIAELKAAGFSVAKEFDFLPYQYFLVFEKK